MSIVWVLGISDESGYYFDTYPNKDNAIEALLEDLQENVKQEKMARFREEINRQKHLTQINIQHNSVLYRIEKYIN